MVKLIARVRENPFHISRELITAMIKCNERENFIVHEVLAFTLVNYDRLNVR